MTEEGYLENSLVVQEPMCPCLNVLRAVFGRLSDRSAQYDVTEIVQGGVDVEEGCLMAVSSSSNLVRRFFDPAQGFSKVPTTAHLRPSYLSSYIHGCSCVPGFISLLHSCLFPTQMLYLCRVYKCPFLLPFYPSTSSYLPPCRQVLHIEYEVQGWQQEMHIDEAHGHLDREVGVVYLACVSPVVDCLPLLQPHIMHCWSLFCFAQVRVEAPTIEPMLLIRKARYGLTSREDW